MASRKRVNISAKRRRIPAPKRRMPGSGKGKWKAVGDFNEPLPPDLLAAFERRRN